MARFSTFHVNLPLEWNEEHLKTLIISKVIHNLRKVWNFSQYLQKFTKTVNFEVVSWIILKSLMFLLWIRFNICIINNRRFYAINKKKVSIIIWQPTVFTVLNVYWITKFFVWNKNLLCLFLGLFKYTICHEIYATF